MKANMFWHKPIDRIPVDIQTILVVYDSAVWPGVYCEGIVNLYPEDFEPVRLDDCELWCALPEYLSSMEQEV